MPDLQIVNPAFILIETIVLLVLFQYKYLYENILYKK